MMAVAKIREESVPVVIILQRLEMVTYLIIKMFSVISVVIILSLMVLVLQF